MNNATGRRRVTHLSPYQAKLRRAQKILGAKSEAETIDRALDFRSGMLSLTPWAEQAVAIEGTTDEPSKRLIKSGGSPKPLFCTVVL
jgi:hypothetical protein